MISEESIQITVLNGSQAPSSLLCLLLHIPLDTITYVEERLLETMVFGEPLVLVRTVSPHYLTSTWPGSSIVAANGALTRS
jgi:hypothetical protein